MKHLHKKLTIWTEANLLSEEQKQAILEFEKTSTLQRSWILHGIMAIGIAAIAIGIISLIAANWWSIPDVVKITSYIILHTCVAALAVRFISRPGLLREGILILFALLFFAGIGLTAQIFHLQSDGWRGLLFWCVLSLPAVLYSTTRPLPYLWFILLLTTHSIWLYKILLSSWPHRWLTLANFSSILLLYAYTAASLWFPQRFQIKHRLWEAMGIVSALTLFLSFQMFGHFLWYSNVAKIAMEHKEEWAIIQQLALSPWVGLLLIAPSILYKQPEWSKTLCYQVIGVLTSWALFISIPILMKLEPHKVLGTLIALSGWWMIATAAASAGFKRLFDLMTLMITLRILTIYFEVFGSMAATGLGLIISGIIIILITWLWFKYRSKFHEKAIRL